ncbi:MAG TPA: hypothetical protein VN241_06095 [Microbacterium sp.]|nr:hypothetical protein [Microbacterium sp.]
MKTLYIGDANFLIGDAVADALVEYHARLASAHTADAVSLRVIGPDGNEETTSFTITDGIPLIVESNRSQLEEPDNTAAVEYMRERTSRLNETPVAVIGDVGDEASRADEFDDV